MRGASLLEKTRMAMRITRIMAIEEGEVGEAGEELAIGSKYPTKTIVMDLIKMDLEVTMRRVRGEEEVVGEAEAGVAEVVRARARLGEDRRSVKEM